MMKQLLIMSLIVFQNAISQNNPEQLTKEFIKGYKVWNDLAFQLDQDKNPSASSLAEKSYKELIQKYCDKNKVYQFLAFGSNSLHSPEEEIVTKTKIKHNKAIVSTRFKDKNFDYLINYYEYHFVLIDGKWLLEEVYLIDEDGKYPGL